MKNGTHYTNKMRCNTDAWCETCAAYYVCHDQKHTKQ